MTICGLFLFRAKALHVKRVFCAEAPNCKHGSARLGRKTLNHTFNFGETDTQSIESTRLIFVKRTIDPDGILARSCPATACTHQCRCANNNTTNISNTRINTSTSASQHQYQFWDQHQYQYQHQRQYQYTIILPVLPVPIVM